MVIVPFVLSNALGHKQSKNRFSTVGNAGFDLFLSINGLSASNELPEY
jgi:hypothetical protein